MILYGAVHDLLRDIPLEQIAAFEQGLFAACADAPVLQEIVKTGRLEQENALKELIETYVRQFLQEEAWKTETQSKTE